MFLVPKQRNQATTKAVLLPVLTSVAVSVYSLDLHVAIFSQASSARYEAFLLCFSFYLKNESCIE